MGLSSSLYGPMKAKAPLGSKLKALRKALRPARNQEQVASEIGATQAMYSKWETGSVVPGLDYAVRLARVFNVGLDDLVSGIDAKYDLACQSRTRVSTSIAGTQGGKKNASRRQVTIDSLQSERTKKDIAKLAASSHALARAVVALMERLGIEPDVDGIELPEADRRGLRQQGSG